MRLNVTSLLLILCLAPRCAGPTASSAPAEPAGASPLATLAASQPASTLTVHDVERRTELQAAQPRFLGRLWTLCDETRPEMGVCLSAGQVREIWLRFGEDQARFKRVAIDAVEGRDKAQARAEDEAAAKQRAQLGAVLGAAGAFLVGIGAGFLLDRFLPRQAAP